MLFCPKQEERIDRLAEKLRLPEEVTPDLVIGLIAGACRRIPMLNTNGAAALRLNGLIDAGAWIDTALALIELELPQWKLRRVLYEDGKWFCSLSRHPGLPIGLDDTADGSHESLPVAILSAFIGALRSPAAMSETRPGSVQQVRPTSGETVCCDDFG